MQQKNLSIFTPLSFQQFVVPPSLSHPFPLCVCIIHGQLSAPLAQLNSRAGSAPWVNTADCDSDSDSEMDVDSGSRRSSQAANQSKSKPNQSSDKTSKTK